MKCKFKFDRRKIIEFFTQHDYSIMFMFHENKLTPTQMINFWKTVPNAQRLMMLRKTMEKISGGEKVDVFEYVTEK